jgi:hypothetical protein
MILSTAGIVTGWNMPEPRKRKLQWDTGAELTEPTDGWRTMQMREERGGVTAGLPALGTWSAAGATVNLFPLRRAAEAAAKEDIELIAVDEAVLVPTAQGHVSLSLLDFGPAGLVPPPVSRPDRHSDLPLFVWATEATG